MGEQGAALQKYNQELVKCIEQLKIKKQELLHEIEKEELVKQDLESELCRLNSELETINSNIKRKRHLFENCERSIKEAECAFMKILESSQVLLSKVLKESEELQIKEDAED